MVWASSFTSADRKSTRLNSSHSQISYAVFCLKKNQRRKTRCSSREDRIRPWHGAGGWSPAPNPPSTTDPTLTSRPGSTARGHTASFFNDTATTEIYTLSLHDALPI